MRHIVLVLVIALTTGGCVAGSRDGKIAAIVVNSGLVIAGGAIAASSGCHDDESCHDGGFSGAVGGTQTGAALVLLGTLALLYNLATMPSDPAPPPPSSP